MKNFKEVSFYIITILLRFITRFFYLFRVKKNRIVLTSFNGKQYSCNPKYIELELKKQYPQKFEIIWALKDVSDPEFFQIDKVVKYMSIKHFFYLMTAKVIIVNNSGISQLLPYRKTQCLINTWHGSGAYKRSGNDVYKSLIQDKIRKVASNNVTVYLSGCRRFTEVQSKAHHVDVDKMLECGLPRNDLFFHEQPGLIKKVKEKLKIQSDCKIVLYAPTFRISSKKQSIMEYGFELINVDLVLNCLRNIEDNPYVFLYRAHHAMLPDTLAENVINASNYSDMQELLYASDILITDYSSCMWDFSLTGKPCFIFAPDAVQYQQERDFYTPMNKWPFPIAYNNKELINNIINFDKKSYDINVKAHLSELGCCETGKASQIVAQKIYDFCFDGSKYNAN